MCTASRAWFMARRRASSARRRAERVGGAAAQEDGFWVDIGVGLGVMLVVEGLAKRYSKSSSSSEEGRGTSGMGGGAAAAAEDGLDMVQLIGDLD